MRKDDNPGVYTALDQDVARPGLIGRTIGAVGSAIRSYFNMGKEYDTPVEERGPRYQVMDKSGGEWVDIDDGDIGSSPSWNYIEDLAEQRGNVRPLVPGEDR
jgi:hypothetical protein